MEPDSAPPSTDSPSEVETYAKLAERLASGGRAYGTAIIIGILAGVVFAIGGIILSILGISGAVDFVIESSDLKARLTNASPGAVIAAMGMIIIWRYKPKLSHEVELRPRRRRSKELDSLSDSEELTFRSRGVQAAPGRSASSGSEGDPDSPTFRSRGSA